MHLNASVCICSKNLWGSVYVQRTYDTITIKYTTLGLGLFLVSLFNLLLNSLHVDHLAGPCTQFLVKPNRVLVWGIHTVGVYPDIHPKATDGRESTQINAKTFVPPTLLLLRNVVDKVWVCIPFVIRHFFGFV